MRPPTCASCDAVLVGDGIESLSYGQRIQCDRCLGRSCTLTTSPVGGQSVGPNPRLLQNSSAGFGASRHWPAGFPPRALEIPQRRFSSEQLEAHPVLPCAEKAKPAAVLTRAAAEGLNCVRSAKSAETDWITEAIAPSVKPDAAPRVGPTGRPRPPKNPPPRLNRNLARSQPKHRCARCKQELPEGWRPPPPCFSPPISRRHAAARPIAPPEHPLAQARPSAPLEHPLRQPRPSAPLEHPLGHPRPSAPLEPSVTQSQPSAPLELPLSQPMPSAPLELPLSQPRPSAPLELPLRQPRPTAPQEPPATQSQPSAPLEPPVTQSQPSAPLEPPVTQSQPSAPLELPLRQPRPSAPQEQLRPSAPQEQLKPSAPLERAVAESKPSAPPPDSPNKDIVVLCACKDFDPCGKAGMVTLRQGYTIEHYVHTAAGEGFGCGKVTETGEVGKFPLDSAGVAPGAPTKVCAAYEFRRSMVAQAFDGEPLPFTAGTILTKLCTHRRSDEWTFGKLKCGKMGWFPTCYVDEGVSV